MMSRFDQFFRRAFAGREERLLDITFGEALAEATDGVNLVDGRKTFEHADSHKHDIAMMTRCCEAEIATWKKTGLVPAPYYFERVAILARKVKDFELEIKICEQYLDAVDQLEREGALPKHGGIKAGPRYKAIKRRLPQAYEFLSKAGSDGEP